MSDRFYLYKDRKYRLFINLDWRIFALETIKKRMQLAPYKARGKEEGYLDPDCLQCERCTMVCPLNIIKMKNKL